MPRRGRPVGLRTTRAVWPVAVSLVLFPILRFGVGERSGNIALSFVALTLAYLLAIHLYYGLALLAYHRRTHLLWSGGPVAAVIGYLVSGVGDVWTIVLGFGMVFFTGVAVGRLADTRIGGLTAYVIGLAIVALCGLALLLPQWPETYRTVSAASRELADSLPGSMITGILGSETTGGQARWLQKISNLVIRFLPMCIIMSSVAQYSVGFLWFASVRSRDEFKLSPLRSFMYWRVPVAVLGVAAAAALFRFAGGPTVRLVADNLLAALSVYFCVTGLALVEYYLCRLKARRGLRAIVYLLLVPAGLIGYFALVLSGLATSLYDWRTGLDSD